MNDDFSVVNSDGTPDYPSHCGLDQLFREQVARSPEAVALLYGSRSLTYAELDEQAEEWAFTLFNIGVRTETPVGILLEPGIEQIVIQVAICRAGGSCVPLDPTQPDQRLQHMLQDLDVNFLVTREIWAKRLPGLCTLIVEKKGASSAFVSALPHFSTARQRTHILHTSGTSGRPKAVEILALGITRLAFNRNFSPITSRDRVAHISNPTFDASLFEIWGALLNGATVVIFSKQSIIDPFIFSENLRIQRISVIFVTTALFNLTAFACPGAFVGVKHLLTGGEVANPLAMREVLIKGAPENFRNIYGPTECTTFAISKKISLIDLDGGAVPLGMAIDHTQVYILNKELSPVQKSEVGEIYLGGDGVARGYWNRPELNRERFVNISHLAENRLLRLYKTGDLARWREDGCVEFVGRSDSQVKIRGYRIEPEEIESVLLGSKQVQKAVVSTIQINSSEAYLVAYVVVLNAEKFDLEKLQLHLRQNLPDYMQPRIELVDEIPLNDNGKADRNALENICKQRIKLMTSSAGDTGISSYSEMQLALIEMWEEALDRAKITINDNFFELGGSSLQAAKLIVQIGRHINQVVPVQMLYSYPTLKEFAIYIDNVAQGIAPSRIDDETLSWIADANLGDDLEPFVGTAPDWLSEKEGRVFLTGVTGFLGAFLLHDLLKIEEVKQVACLVRAKNSDHARQRIHGALSEYSLWKDEFIERIVPICGDLSSESLGLDKTEFDKLGEWASVIFHAGAHVNYIQPYTAHRPANVLGTLNVLRLANTGRIKALHYLSSIAAYGPTGFFTGSRFLAENEPLRPHVSALKYDTGYSQSKWVAEQLIWAAQKKGGAVAIYRPGFIMGDSLRGVGNPKDFVARFIKGCILLGSYPELSRQRKEFVTVDYVSGTLLQIARGTSNLGNAYNLVPLNSHDSVDLDNLFDLLGKCGFQLKPLSYSQWVHKLSTHPNLSKSPLFPLLPMLMEQVYGQLTRWEVYEDMPIYDTTNVRNILEQNGSYTCPRFDQNLLQLYLDNWVAKGFLSSSQKQLESDNEYVDAPL
jgi:amino acid adenylation domain-containing protein/thioester reductase-like protein